MDIVLYRPDWQKLRVSCIKEYNEYRGFLTADGTEDNLNRLNNYITDAATPAKPYAIEAANDMHSTIESEYATRVYRVYSYLHSTINGLASLRLDHVNMIKDYYKQLLSIMNTAPVVEMADNWDWSVVNEELQLMWVVDRVWFQRIYDDMNERIFEKNQRSLNMLRFKGLMNAIVNY